MRSGGVTGRCPAGCRAGRDLLDRQVAVVAERDNDPVIRREVAIALARTSRSCDWTNGSPDEIATSTEMSVACRRADRSRSRQVLTRIRSNHGSKRAGSRSVDHFRHACRTRRAWRPARPSGRAGCARQAVGGVEMLVGQAQEGLGALGRLLGHGGPAVCHLDDLGRSAHDDMTIQRGKTFTTELARARDESHQPAQLSAIRALFHAEIGLAARLESSVTTAAV